MAPKLTAPFWCMAILTVISIGIFISTHSLRSNPSTHMFGWEEMSKPEADVFSV